MRTIRYVKSLAKHQILVQSITSRKLYILTWDTDLSIWRCTCGDAKFRGNKNCKHVKAVRNDELDIKPSSQKDEFDYA